MRHRARISFAALPSGSASPAVKPVSSALENVVRLRITAGATGTPNAANALRASPLSEGFPRTVRRWASIQHDQRPPGGAIDDVKCAEDCAKVEDRRPGRDQYQVGLGSDVSHVRFDAGPGVDNQVDAIGAGGVDNAAQPGWLGFHQCAGLRLPCPPPSGGAALGIQVDQERPLSGLRQHGEMDGERRFPDAPFLTERADHLHRSTIALSR
jgi:hypothetical protein